MGLFFSSFFTHSVSVGKKKLHATKSKQNTHNTPSSKPKQVYWGMAIFEQGMKWIVLCSVLVFQGNLGTR